MNGEEIIDELTYRSYVYNRERFPEIKAERWIMAYPDAEAMEKRYQASVNRQATAAIERAKTEPDWLRNMRQGSPDTKPGYP
jgi:hypothetical protein